MNRIAEQLVTELRRLIADLGKDGGLMSPSVYDTAQVLRFVPPQDVHSVVDWLLEQQAPDGGWGDPLLALARHVPTLATLLALQPYTYEKRVRAAIAAGKAWFRENSACWQAPLPEGIPVGVELILPQLLYDAGLGGLGISPLPFVELIALGERRRHRLRQLPVRAGSSAAHSWEAWGSNPDPQLLDGTGSIGHSPAATAAWLHAARGREDLKAACLVAEDYLVKAAASTGVGVRGVVPTAYPITRFEQSNALYVLLLADLLDHPALASVLRPQIADLSSAVRSTGLGFSDYFDPDGDDTAEALAVGRGAGRANDLAPLSRFADDDHYCAYPGELHPSPSMVAHALHTLSLFGITSARVASYLASRQAPDGRWMSDKWNASWLYTTSHAVIALHDSRQITIARRGVSALVAAQDTSGGWGERSISAEETSFTMLALQAMSRSGTLERGAAHAARRGGSWLAQHYRPYERSSHACWLAKELYRPYRLSRMAELAATFRSLHVQPGVTADQRRPVWTVQPF